MPESASAWQHNCDGEFELSLFQELSLRKGLLQSGMSPKIRSNAFNGSTTRHDAVDLDNFNLEPFIGYLSPNFSIGFILERLLLHCFDM
jgi:hypothetical protein